MEQNKSAFVKWINGYFKGLVIKTTQKLIGAGPDGQLSYMSLVMLRREYSVTGKWEAISVQNTRVRADYVGMDSSLPVKVRDSFGKASGDIVKSGMEMWLNEKQLSELDTMVDQGSADADIVAKLFAETPKVIAGIYELIEQSFLEGLSTGVTVIDDIENVGLGVRLDYGYLDSNKFGVSVLWSSASTAKPLNDLAKAVKKAKRDGNTITNVYMDDVTFENFVNTQQVKDYFAFSIGFVGNSALVPVPTLESINNALRKDNKYRFTITIMDRTIINERNGNRTTVTPWEEGKVILTTSQQVGVLAWAKLVEEKHPVEGVTYQKADEFILVSQFRTNRPTVREFTTSQARVVPVICDVDKIYQIDAKVVQA